MKTLMIVGSGPWQLHLIRKAKARGYYVVNTNLYEDSEGFADSDAGEVVDIYDKARHLELARRYSVDGVTTDQIDIAVPTVAYVCEKLGLPGIGIDTAELFTNKVRMREFAQSKGFLQPAFRVCRSVEEGQAAARELGYPVIIKPTDNQSSRGVHKAGTPEELAAKHVDTRANSRGPEFLVEEFIGGVELSVEGFKTRRRHTSLAVSVKEQFSSNTLLDSRVYYPKDDRTFDLAALKRVQDALMDATMLPFGITHAEYKCFEGRFYLIEFAARGGGANISSHIIPLLSGVDVTGLLLRSAMGEDVGEVSAEDQRVAAVLEFFVLPAGKVKAIRGFDTIRAMPNVVDAGLTFKVGDVLAPPAHGGARAGHFIAYEESDAALHVLSETIKSTLRIDYE